MNQVVDRKEGMGFGSRTSLGVTGDGRRPVRVTALKMHSRDAMNADLGTAKLGAKSNLSDWNGGHQSSSDILSNCRRRR